MTRIKPMPPASRPAFNWDEPSVADTVTASSAVKLNGSAPYLSWSANRFADDDVKLPLICVFCPVIGSSVPGAEITWTSSTNATYTEHGVDVTAHVVALGTVAFAPPRLCALVHLPHADCPLSFSVSTTVHSVWPWLVFGACADAVEICRPATIVGPSRYARLAPPPRSSHAM